jgi:hypothetical protein
MSFKVSVCFLACLMLALLGGFDSSYATTPAQSTHKAKLAEPQSDRAQALGLLAQAREVCSLIGQNTQDQMKTCKYSCASGDIVITVKASNQCPQSVQR